MLDISNSPRPQRGFLSSGDTLLSPLQRFWGSQERRVIAVWARISVLKTIELGGGRARPAK